MHNINTKYTESDRIPQESLISIMITPCGTPQNKSEKLSGAFGVPMFIPPTPMLQNLGYGTGMCTP